MDSIAAGNIAWTGNDLRLLATDEWKRYEIVDGELFVTRAPHIGHQDAAGRIYARLLVWSEATELGKPLMTPGLIFSDIDNVIPDVVWVSRERLAQIVDQEGHLTEAPELIVEVLSAGAIHERRDREVKRKLYSLKGVQEYWIVDWRLRQIEVYRRGNNQLQLVATLLVADDISSPLLPGFHCPIKHFV